MENNEIISIVINKMNEEDLWFTQKTDPTWGNPSHYYKLDEYGDPTESSIKEIVKEVTAYIGDGAVGPEDAVDIWIQEALADYRIAYTSTLVTKFKDKPVVDGIEAYKSKVLKNEGYSLGDDSESFDIYAQTLDFLKMLGTILEKRGWTFKNNCFVKDNKMIEISTSQDNVDELYFESNNTNLSKLTQHGFDETGDDFYVCYYISSRANESTAEDIARCLEYYTYVDEKKEEVKTENIDDSMYVSKYDELDNLIDTYIVTKQDKLDLYNTFNAEQLTDLSGKNEMIYDEWLFNMKEEHFEDLKEYLDDLDTETENYIDEINETKLSENYKRRLKEENNKSANLISQMFQANDFDSDSKAGQIVMRTSELFNALSDKGYDVQVAFDNGESTNTILLGQQGGQVIITITDTNQPLRAFTSGNFEINDDNIQVLSDIKEQISTI